MERSKIGELPLKEHEQKFWDEACRKHEKTAQEINRSIDKFNLIVPILDKQMVQIQIKMIADRVLEKGIFGGSEMPKDNKEQTQMSNEKASLFTLIGSFFMN